MEKSGVSLMMPAELAFWVAIVIVVYAYLGYPAIIWGLGYVSTRPLPVGALIPTITVLIAAHNEERQIADKIENCLALTYPPERLDLIVVSDGSTDRTVEIAGEYATRFPNRIAVVSIPARRGKANALNVGAALASGEILLLADVRQRFDLMVARMLARNFAASEVGAVSGELILLEEGATECQDGLGLYWRYEKALRKAESRFASTIGYTGAIAAVRRSLFTGLPEETLVEDLVMPLRLIARGYRVIFEPAARAIDQVSRTAGHEFPRKVRTLAGVLQTLFHLRQFVGPLGFQAWWQFTSHKVLRLVVPYALIVALLTSALMTGPLYRAALIAQLFAYGLGVIGLLSSRRSRWRRLTSPPSTFLMLNLAVVISTLWYLAGRRLELWQKASSEGVMEA
jgi:cellulose synthase/poly-beta-1,6-N-acetylglucosamine synthase-like glycosyltransferase